MDTEENDDANTIAIGAQTTPAELNPGEVRDAAQRIQESVLRFSQGDQSYQENLGAVMKQVSGQLRATNLKVQQNRAEIDTLGSRLRNYRS